VGKRRGCGSGRSAVPPVTPRLCPRACARCRCTKCLWRHSVWKSRAVLVKSRAGTPGDR
jgi:hypothetical protein